jgi:hypothetical protein
VAGVEAELPDEFGLICSKRMDSERAAGGDQIMGAVRLPYLNQHARMLRQNRCGKHANGDLPARFAIMCRRHRTHWPPQPRRNPPYRPNVHAYSIHENDPTEASTVKKM